MKKIHLLTVGLFLIIGSTLAQSPLNSLDFDGTNDYTSSTLPTVFNNITNNDFTMELWIKPNANSFSRAIFAQLDANNFTSISLGASNEVFFYVSNVAGQTSSTNLPVGVWSHVACTWDASSSQVEIYINGVLDASAAPLSMSSTGSDNLMTIGAKTNATQFFSGEMDEVRIWDVVRTSCDISAAMNSDFTVSQPNLVAYYNFNVGVAGGTNTGITSLPDFTTNHNATLFNFNLTSTSSNWVTSGAVINIVNQPNSAATSTDTITVCNSHIWIDGVNYTSNTNTPTFKIIGGAASGCDSIITLDLTILNVSDLTTTTSGLTISANNTGATYQWLNCDSNHAIISGENGQTYIANANGNYAVELTENGCVDTSACISIVSVGITESNFENELIVYPNPTISGNFSIDLGSTYETSQISIRDISGKLISSKTMIQSQILNLSIEDSPAGIYLISIQTNDNKAVIRLMKE